MPAEVLKCPMCGAAASTDSSRCDHCGARLATVACPSCFGMMFVGEKFCPHCGTRAARIEESETTSESCPRCKIALEAVVVGTSHMRECPKCEGIWLDAATLRQICEAREEQTAVLGMASHLPEADTEASAEIPKVVYLPCPVCKQLMNRVNFANCSHVIVDVCNQHGTWFDHDDLRHIVEFIQGGGMELARKREMEDLEDERRRVAAQAAGLAAETGVGLGETSSSSYDRWEVGIGAAAGLLRLFLR